MTISGHADFAEYGQDIVCAAVSSALQLTANAITDLLDVKASIVERENLISLNLPQPLNKQAVLFLKALWLHLGALAEEYPKNIQLSLTEV